MENFLYKAAYFLKIIMPLGAIIGLITTAIVGANYPEYGNYIIYGFCVWLASFVLMGIIGIILLYDTLDAFGWFAVLFLIIMPTLVIIYFIIRI